MITFFPSYPASVLPFSYVHKNSLVNCDWIESVLLEVHVVLSSPMKGFKKMDVRTPVLVLWGILNLIHEMIFPAHLRKFKLLHWK